MVGRQYLAVRDAQIELALVLWDRVHREQFEALLDRMSLATAHRQDRLAAQLSQPKAAPATAAAAAAAAAGGGGATAPTPLASARNTSAPRHRPSISINAGVRTPSSSANASTSAPGAAAAAHSATASPPPTTTHRSNTPIRRPSLHARTPSAASASTPAATAAAVLSSLSNPLTSRGRNRSNTQSELEQLVNDPQALAASAQALGLSLEPNRESVAVQQLRARYRFGGKQKRTIVMEWWRALRRAHCALLTKYREERKLFVSNRRAASKSFSH
jgi:hypothetical protein